MEIQSLNSKYNFKIPNPDNLIFGHTHCPISWNDPKPPQIKYRTDDKTLKMNFFNTGGWLHGKDKNGKKEFCGAEIFKYQTSEGISSIRIN